MRHNSQVTAIRLLIVFMCSGDWDIPLMIRSRYGSIFSLSLLRTKSTFRYTYSGNATRELNVFMLRIGHPCHTAS